MTELTTLRVAKPTVDWLNTLKGHLEYISGEKLTLNDALMSILAEMDWLYLKGNCVTKSKEKEVHLPEFREHLEDLRKKQSRGYFFGYLREGFKSFLIEVPKFIGKEGLNTLVKTTMSVK